jgi:ATP-binding cassette subfamily F protein uup
MMTTAADANQVPADTAGADTTAAPGGPNSRAPAPSAPPVKPRKGRLAPWEREELDALPAQIATLEAEQAALAQALSDPDLYRDGADKADQIQQSMTALQVRLEALFERWTLLEDKQGQ